MTKSATVQARIEPQLKEEVDVIFAALGINATTAITLFYSQIARHRGIPLELKVPNEETLVAMRELKTPAFRKTAERFESVRSLMADLNS